MMMMMIMIMIMMMMGDEQLGYIAWEIYAVVSHLESTQIESNTFFLFVVVLLC
jgi:hypothetical protein